ncbi:MAG TPA: lysylphosphatidylglycerol synthase transmembrane domain-containing protein [Acidimicrobiales bacterium]|nr:lysylphosphatidylglycerol synthase transmembrane domain-containing protein [Acidimicrobiales bacterium]
MNLPGGSTGDAPARATARASEPAQPSVLYRRSPRSLGLALAAAAVAGSVVGLIHLLNQTDRGLREDVREVADRLPDSAGPVLDALAMTAAAVLLLAVVADQLLRRRVRAAVNAVLGAAVGAAAIGGAAAAGLDERWVGEPGWDQAVTAAAGAAGAVVAAGVLVTGARWARTTALVSLVAFALGGAWGAESVGGRTWVLAAGVALGAAVLVLVGTPSQAATEAEVEEGLQAIGMVPRSIEAHPGDARGSVPWFVELESGTRLFVKTASAEERIADLLFRLWRRIRLKESGDPRPHASLQQAAEHESFAATRAAAVGVRTPRVLGLGTLPDGGVFSLHEAIDGRSLQDLVRDEGPEAVEESTLREAWSMLATLHRARIAHRDVRAANVVVDEESAVWLVDFAFAELAASEELRQRDLVELLCSTAALLGPERAVDAAVTTLGEATWLEALPLVQPLATTSATRTALGREGFAEVRRLLTDRLQAAEPELPRLGRLDLRTLLSVLALGVATWTLLPQLARSGDVWEQVPEADLLLLLGAVGFSLLTYVGAATSLKGSVPRDLPLGRTVLSQLASSFANRVTPAKVGGIALNVRWMVKEGVEAPVAAAGVSVNAVVGFVIHVLGTVFVVLWAGQAGLGDLDAPPGRTIGVGVALVAGVLVVTYLIPPLRRTLRHRVWPRTRQSFTSVAEVATDRRRVVLLFGGSALVTVSYIGALALSLAAVDASVPIATVALVYLAGSAVASAAPTPGGLGATEATFAAALSAVGVGDVDAVAAVLLYRLVTFWLPILPGWLSYTALRRADRL